MIFDFRSRGTRWRTYGKHQKRTIGRVLGGNSWALIRVSYSWHWILPLEAKAAILIVLNVLTETFHACQLYDRQLFYQSTSAAFDDYRQ